MGTVESRYRGALRVVKVDVDEQSKLAMCYGVKNIPTLVLLKNDREAARIVGAVPLETITAKLEEHGIRPAGQ
jgi:thioredoxin